MPDTTTLATIMSRYVTDIKAITPSRRSGDLFDRCPKRYPLRTWAVRQNQSSSVFRRFDVRRGGPTENPYQYDPGSKYTVESVLISVAYPILPDLYRTGEVPDDDMDMESLIYSDAHQIWEVVFNGSNYVAGEQFSNPTINEPETDGNVVFQTISVSTLYVRAVSF